MFGNKRKEIRKIGKFKNFREQQTEGFCHCGLYKKVEIE